MRYMIIRFIAVFAACLLANVSSTPCQAHFLWIKTVTVDGNPHGLVFFNEGPADETYHFPEKLAKVKLWGRAADGKPAELATKGVDTEDRAGLIGPLGEAKTAVLWASEQYGIYHGSLLTYHAKHICGTTAEAINKAGTEKELKLEIVPTITGDKVEFAVMWEGKPLAAAGLTVVEGDGEPVELKADDKGRASLAIKGGGLIGALANQINKEQAGEFNGEPFKGAMHYASLTFRIGAQKDEPPKSADSTTARGRVLEDAAILTPLPEPVASFGAVVCDGWLYVYGGHTGGEHEHSAANLSKHFRRIRLDGSNEWQELSMQTPLQGLPLVAHSGKVFRVGGLEIRNPTLDDEEDLHSTAKFAEYDPATGEWTELTPLPAARSSHNAAVIGDKLYVVGGWRLEGQSPGTWEPDALVYDFKQPAAGWQKLPAPDFQRRALAAGVWNGKLVALGGMDESGKVSLRVDLFDPQTEKWEKGPSLPAAKMAGFGASAWNLNGDLYVCDLSGTLHRLSENGSKWEKAGRLVTPRFFHQLVPGPDGGLMVVGGASPEGHLATIERVEMSKTRAATN